MPHKLVEQLRFTRSESLRALRGVPEEDGFRRFLPLNSIGWIVAHRSWQEQRFFITWLQGQAPVPNVNELANGGPAKTPSQKQIQAAWKEFTRAADAWLDTLDTDAIAGLLPACLPAESETRPGV